MSQNSLVAKPEWRPDTVDEILSTLKRYDVSVIKDLEDYLNEQYKGEFSDLNSNLALLKLYELSDETSIERQESTIKILIKGLVRFIDQDFPLYLHLLPPYIFMVKDEYATKIQNLVSLYELLIVNKMDEFVARNKEFDSIVDEHSAKLIEQTFLLNKNSDFIISDNVASEDVPITKLAKIVGTLVKD